MPEQLISEAIHISTILRTWRETGKCHHCSPELYVRKHWLEVAVDDGVTMKIYFDRQPRRCRGHKEPGWWLFSISGPEGSPWS